MFEDLIGERLSSVEFVADYVQLHFDDASLSCFVWPTVEIPEENRRSFGDEGYRDTRWAT